MSPSEMRHSSGSRAFEGEDPKNTTATCLSPLVNWCKMTGLLHRQLWHIDSWHRIWAGTQRGGGETDTVKLHILLGACSDCEFCMQR